MDDGAKLEAQGDLEEALSAYARSRQWNNAARLALSLDRNLEAASYCLEARRPYDAAVCFQKVGALKECLGALIQVPSTSPRYRPACVHAVRVALVLGTPLASLSSFTLPFISSKPVSPSEAVALNQLAAAFAKTDKVRLASSIYRSVVSAYPEDPEAKEGLDAVAKLSEAAAPSPVWVPPPAPAALKPPPSAPGRVSRQTMASSRTARLGQLLVSKGGLNQLQLELVLRQQPEVSGSDLLLGEALVASGCVSDLDVVQALSEQSGIPFITEEKLLATASPEAAHALTLEQVERWKVAPISLIDRHLCLAMRDPRDIAVIDKLRFASGMSQVIGVFATELAIRRGIGKLYHGEDPQQQDIGEWRAPAWDKTSAAEAPAPFSDRYTGTRERQFDTGDLEKRMRVEIGSAEPEAPASGAQRTLAMQVLPKIGSTFAGRYRLEALIGEGGSATIFKAIDIELNEPVALKLFRPSTPAEAENLIARFKLELSLSRLLSHPNIIRLFDLGAHEGWRYLTMELLEGRDLALMLGAKAEPIGLRTGLRILDQVCVGLQFAHEQGVVHRDIKPQNLFITHDGVAKLMDFGIAKKLRSTGVTVAGMVAGTPEFISPEQIKSFASVTHLTDLYALGATAYMMFTGAPPFTHPELIGLLMAQANDPPPPPRQKNPEIPLDLEAAILKLLEKDPARRFQSARDFGAALRAIRERLDAAEA